MAATVEMIRKVYEVWHEGTKAQDAPSMAALYADDAVLETAAVLALWPNHGSGIVIGRGNIERFFAENFELNSDVFAEWYRTDVFFSDGRILIWEYPRKTPSGQQAGLVESMDINDAGLISEHRVYWGWRGVSSLITKSSSGSPLDQGGR
jgi:steroid delta-isomerase